MRIVIELDYDTNKGMVSELTINGTKVDDEEMRISKALAKIENVLVWSERK